MTFPTAPPTAPSSQHNAPQRRSDRFFAWTAGVGIARSEGWIGGVAAGIAARLRIDPLIVRGVLVVATLCGLPLILFYALAWALLPDATGRIHLRELLHARFEPAQLGILIGVIGGLMGLAPLSILGLALRVVTGSYNGDDYGFRGPTPLSVLGFLFGLALVIVLLVFIVRAARRTPGGSLPDPRMASAATATPDASAPVSDSDIATGVDGLAPESPSRPAAPHAPAASADADALEAWRAQHAAWQQQDRVWREQQQDAERVARDQARHEREQAAAVFSAEATERRRIRRASKPRASFAYVATVLGLAIVIGAVVWLVMGAPTVVTVAMSLLVAALVLAFAMVLAGVARRRSGFLAFLTASVLSAALITGAAASAGDVMLGSASVSNAAPVQVRQPFGMLSVWLSPLEGGESNAVVVQKGEGYTEIWVQPGVQLDLTATVKDASVNWTTMTLAADGSSEHVGGGAWMGSALSDGSRVIRESVASAPAPPTEASASGGPGQATVAPVTIDQASGSVSIIYYVLAKEETTE